MTVVLENKNELHYYYHWIDVRLHRVQGAM